MIPGQATIGRMDFDTRNPPLHICPRVLATVERSAGSPVSKSCQGPIHPEHAPTDGEPFWLSGLSQSQLGKFGPDWDSTSCGTPQPEYAHWQSGLRKFANSMLSSPAMTEQFQGSSPEAAIIYLLLALLELLTRQELAQQAMEINAENQTIGQE
jgi:hypothetical protein